MLSTGISNIQRIGRNVGNKCVNGAYIILGLLYGQGDFEKTIDISTRAGQDSDCNPASSGGILGTMIGYNRIPEKFRKELTVVADTPFNNAVSFNKGCELSFEHALQKKTVEKLEVMK